MEDFGSKNMIEKLIYLEWGYEYDNAIQKAWKDRGVEIIPYKLEKKLDEKICSSMSELSKQNLEKCIEDNRVNVIFSINFISEISEICKRNDIFYYAWVLVLPNMDLFTASIDNLCNRVGICDSFLVERLWKRNTKNIFYIPDAIEKCHRVRKDFVRPCSYMQKLPFSYLDTPFGDRTKGLSENTMGYLTGVIHCQRVLYGATMLEEILMGTAAEEFLAQYPLPDKILPEFHKLYVSEAYLSPEVTRLEQIIFLQNMSSGVDIEVFTNGHFKDCTNKQFPYPERLDERGDIYGSSIINLVQAESNIHDAIPHQTLEIMASGNFVLTNYQKDYSYFFNQGEDIVCFGDRVERVQLFNEYGTDANKRERVIEAAYEKIQLAHTYTHRVEYMLSNWG